MNMKLDFNLTIYVLTVKTAGYICFGNEDGNVTYWTDAVKECQLATPDITLDDEGYRAYVQDAEWSGQVWTGYYMSSLAFDYIDCVRTPERKPDYINNLNAPGTCHSVCKTSDTVGLKGDECYCLNNEQFEKTAQPSCDILCDSVENVACGGHQHMSIYRISNVSVYIIVAVIAVLIIIGAAVATFLWRKRRSSFYRQEVPVKYESGENDYTTPKFKEDDGNIYSEIVDTSETRSEQYTDKDGYEVPL